MFHRTGPAQESAVCGARRRLLREIAFQGPWLFLSASGGCFVFTDVALIFNGIRELEQSSRLRTPYLFSIEFVSSSRALGWSRKNEREELLRCQKSGRQIRSTKWFFEFGMLNLPRFGLEGQTTPSPREGDGPCHMILSLGSNMLVFKKWKV
jgi:hypothetical protein